MNSKKLMVLGKCLIVLGLMYPVPLWYIFCEFKWPYTIGVPMPATNGYWWPLLIVMAVGLGLCVFSAYKSKNAETMKNISFQDSMLGLAFRVLKWSLVSILGFYLFVLLIIALYHLFFTELLLVSAPILWALVGVGYLISVGVKYYKNHKDD